MKEALKKAPVLALPNFQKKLVVETNALGMGVGAILMKDQHPITFISRTLNKQQQSLSTYEKELLVVVFAVQKWRHYLLSSQFVVRTDHYSLKYLLD